MEMKTMEMPKIKLMVNVWPNNAADAKPVKIVATVEEYFFKIVSASNKSNMAETSLILKSETCLLNSKIASTRKRKKR